MATSGDLDLATSGYFFMATDMDAEDARRDVIAMLSEHAATDSNR